MSYYKITYESDTIDGLKAIQGNSAGRSANAGSNSIEDSAPPPPQANQNASAFSDNVEAPPLSNAGGMMGFLDENASVPPPPQAASSAMTSANPGDETPPPPTNETQAGEALSKEGIAPPEPPMPKNPKTP